MNYAVFVSGPYSGNEYANVQTAIDMSNELIDRSILPLCPHLWFYCDEKKSRDYDVWLNLAFELLLRADAMIVLPGESEGKEKEIQFANDNNIPIFYSLAELDDCIPSKDEDGSI